MCKCTKLLSNFAWIGEGTCQETCRAPCPRGSRACTRRKCSSIQVHVRSQVYALRGYESESNSAITPSTFRWTWPTMCPAIRYGSRIYSAAHLRVTSPSSFSPPPFISESTYAAGCHSSYLHSAGNAKYSCSSVTRSSSSGDS